MNVTELAKKYYPKFWDDKRIAALVEAGRLTQEQAEEIRGKGNEVGADEAQ